MAGVAGRSGPPGNKNSAQENRLFASAIRRVAVQNDGEKLRLVAEKLFEQATAGDVPSAREIGDRLDGKPAQAIVGPDNGPVQVMEVPWLKQRDR